MDYPIVAHSPHEHEDIVSLPQMMMVTETDWILSRRGFWHRLSRDGYLCVHKVSGCLWTFFIVFDGVLINSPHREFENLEAAKREAEHQLEWRVQKASKP